MWKFIGMAWKVWSFIRPIFSDLMRIIKEVKESDLTGNDARAKVVQDITDFIQARGLQKIPDSVLNAGIELCYQLYVWKQA